MGALNFSQNVEDFDDSVFINAAYFRVHRMRGVSNGYHNMESMDVTTFREAMVRAHEELGRGVRVLVYAVTEHGRFVNLIPKRWEHYAQLTLQHK